MTVEQLSEASLNYINQASLSKRKELGQYMTPKAISDILLQRLPLKDGDKVLDPAVGTGELLGAAYSRNPNIRCYGWDIDNEILNVAQTSYPNFEFAHRSGLDLISDTEVGTYDVVIANPPYFEMRPTPEQQQEFKNVISGRANIFSLFFQQAIKLTKNGGHIGFIVPPSLNAGAFFRSLRKYILANTELVHLEIIRKSSHFIDAQTAVQVIILKKVTNSGLNPVHTFSVKTPNELITILTEDSEELKNNWENKSSLYDLGYIAITGTIPWNQFKNSLASEKTSIYTFPLIYAKDISSDNKIKLNTQLQQRRFLTCDKAPIHEEVLLVNRIVGSLESPNLRIAKFNGSKQPFYAENHVNVILPHHDFKAKISLSELYERIISDTKLLPYIKALTGNTQISAKELSYLIPF